MSISKPLGFHDPAYCWVLPKARLDEAKEFYDQYRARRGYYLKFAQAEAEELINKMPNFLGGQEDADDREE